MADNYVQVPAQGVGLKVDTSELTVGANTVERQRINIADSSTAAAVAPVLNTTPGGSAYGLVVRFAGSLGTVTTNADVVDGSTTAPADALLIAGKSADGTPVYAAIPLAAGAASVVISGAVTANAGSNLNTSALATAAKQPALGTAGTASADVITVQGRASMTKLLVTPDSVALPNNQSVNLSQVGAATVALGSTTSAGCIPVVIASDQAAVAVKQATGSNLHAVIDSGTITAITAISNALPAGTNLLGTISASAETSTVYSGTTALTPLFSVIAASSSGANTVIAAVTSKRIRVVALLLTANGAVNAKWQSHVTPTDLTGLAYLAANGGYTLPYNPLGWFQTVSGEALDINLSGAVAVGGMITYLTI